MWRRVRTHRCVTANRRPSRQLAVPVLVGVWAGKRLGVAVAVLVKPGVRREGGVIIAAEQHPFGGQFAAQQGGQAVVVGAAAESTGHLVHVVGEHGDVGHVLADGVADAFVQRVGEGGVALLLAHGGQRGF